MRIDMTYKYGKIQCELLVSDIKFLSHVVDNLDEIQTMYNYSNNFDLLRHYSYLEGFFDSILELKGARKNNVVKVGISNVRVRYLIDMLKMFIQKDIFIDVAELKDKEKADEKARAIIKYLDSQYAHFLAE